jgi:hypothetical protein
MMSCSPTAQIRIELSGLVEGRRTRLLGWLQPAMLVALRNESALFSISGGFRLGADGCMLPAASVVAGGPFAAPPQEACDLPGAGP